MLEFGLFTRSPRRRVSWKCSFTAGLVFAGLCSKRVREVTETTGDWTEQEVRNASVRSRDGVSFSSNRLPDPDERISHPRHLGKVAFFFFFTHPSIPPLHPPSRDGECRNHCVTAGDETVCNNRNIAKINKWRGGFKATTTKTLCNCVLNMMTFQSFTPTGDRETTLTFSFNGWGACFLSARPFVFSILFPR